MLQVGALTCLLGLPLANAQKESPPDVPESIAALAGEEVILFAHATGSQIYTCQAGGTASSLGPLQLLKPSCMIVRIR
jgi:hypothetical protein